MNQEHIVSTYDQTVPLWDEATNKPAPKKITHTIRTEAAVPKLGVMLVGLGGNNGSTFTAGILANKKNLQWETKRGMESPNFYGSFTQCATTHVGYKYNEETNNLQDVHKPIKEIMPMVNPTDFVISGWDISGHNLYDACKRAHVLEPTLINGLKEDLEAIKPLPAVIN